MTSENNTKEITLKYELNSLPTAQHKAGLAGLLVMIETMKRRGLSSIPRMDHLDGQGAKITFTKESLQAVFDDLYDAAWVETKVKAKWPSKAPKAEIQEEITGPDGKIKKQKYFIYDVVQPKGAFLATLFPDGDGGLLKLWRDMIWGILRGKPKSRIVYQERADGKSSSLGSDLWKGLDKYLKSKKKNKIINDKIASSIFIGAQDKNAERVPFRGPIEQNLLLHFWSIVTLVYVPKVVSIDGSSKDCGFALTIPEPIDLEFFLEDIMEMISSLETKVVGYRPLSSLISIPQEAGLEYLYNLSLLKTKSKTVSTSTAAVEVYHLEKRGNNIQLLAAEKILSRKANLQAYERLRKTAKNPFYKSVRICNLLRDEAWYIGFDNLFSVYPVEFFVSITGKTPKRIPFFGRDVKGKFKAMAEEYSLQEKGNEMQDVQVRDDDLLALKIHNLIRQYVFRKTEQRSGIKWSDFKDKKDDKGRVQAPGAYREALQKVCQDAFLAMRGRREEDFVEYFSGTICSVPHFLPEKDFLLVTRALINEPEKVKLLAMIAVSANSYLN